MILAISWSKRNVYDVGFVFCEHIVAIFPIVKSLIFTRYTKTSIKKVFQVGEIEAMLCKISALLFVSPRACFIFAHALNLHYYVDFGKNERPTWG